MRVMITAPPEVGASVIRFLKEHHGFVDIDWCVMERPDLARVDFDPADPLTTSYFDGGTHCQ